MNLRNTVLSLLDIFRLNKGRKIVEESSAVPLTPLLQRLTLPVMIGADNLCLKEKAAFIADAIKQNICEKRLKKEISKRVVHKISRYYGMENLKSYGFFRAIQEKPSLLKYVGA